MKIYIHCDRNYDTIEYHCNKSDDTSSWLSNAKEIGIHCGARNTAESIQNGKPGSKIYKLTLRPNLITLRVDDPDPDKWCSVGFLLQLLNENVISKDEYNVKKKEIFDCISSEGRSKILRKFLYDDKNIDMLAYLNTVEGTEDENSYSYIILDDSAIENIEEV